MVMDRKNVTVLTITNGKMFLHAKSLRANGEQIAHQPINLSFEPAIICEHVYGKS